MVQMHQLRMGTRLNQIRYVPHVSALKTAETLPSLPIQRTPLRDSSLGKREARLAVVAVHLDMIEDAVTWRDRRMRL